MVLVFFGFVATAGSAFVQVEGVPAAAWWGSLAVGLLACAILVANNVRDIATDTVSGKRTIAVRIGDSRARRLYVVCLVVAFLAVVPIALEYSWALLAFLAVPLAVQPVRLVLRATEPPLLVAALIATGRLELVTAVLLSVGLCLR
jgi:1,4-dihydroxy-2-naphthoate octaprenyltransferase